LVYLRINEEKEERKSSKRMRSLHAWQCLIVFSLTNQFNKNTTTIEHGSNWILLEIIIRVTLTTIQTSLFDMNANETTPCGLEKQSFPFLYLSNNGSMSSLPFLLSPLFAMSGKINRPILKTRYRILLDECDSRYKISRKNDTSARHIHVAIFFTHML